VHRTHRFRDREESRFYQARGPEETWQVLGDELGRVLNDAQRAFWCAPLHVEPERIRWWHGAIFSRHFPHDGGTFRRELAYFGVQMPSGGLRQLQGVPPRAIRDELGRICATFNGRADVLTELDSVGVIDCKRAVAALYAGILRVHPFVDGNHRVGFVALSAGSGRSGFPMSSSTTMRWRLRTTMRWCRRCSPRAAAPSRSPRCWRNSFAAR